MKTKIPQVVADVPFQKIVIKPVARDVVLKWQSL